MTYMAFIYVSVIVIQPGAVDCILSQVLRRSSALIIFLVFSLYHFCRLQTWISGTQKPSVPLQHAASLGYCPTAVNYINQWMSMASLFYHIFQRCNKVSSFWLIWEGIMIFNTLLNTHNIPWKAMLKLICGISSVYIPCNMINGIVQIGI